MRAATFWCRPHRRVCTFSYGVPLSELVGRLAGGRVLADCESAPESVHWQRLDCDSLSACHPIVLRLCEIGERDTVLFKPVGQCAAAESQKLGCA